MWGLGLLSTSLNTLGLVILKFQGNKHPPLIPSPHPVSPSTSSANSFISQKPCTALYGNIIMSCTFNLHCVCQTVLELAVSLLYPYFRCSGLLKYVSFIILFMFAMWVCVCSCMHLHWKECAYLNILTWCAARDGEYDSAVLQLGREVSSTTTKLCNGSAGCSNGGPRHSC